MAKLKTADEIRNQLDFLQNKLDCFLVIDGDSLQLCLNLFKNEFIEIVITTAAYRYSPTPKADIAKLIRDFTQKRFSHLTKPLLWHGRNSYRRSAKLAQFVTYCGLIISAMQAVFSAIFYFAPIALSQGWLTAEYATVYTLAPVFSLVLDRDVEDLALLYPKL